ncbi:exopeptide [Sinorhizobium medicae]|uniref:Exopeptide n=2 Tax=Sinorhizobium medicae TaxID=110321 RepID=A0ABX4TRX8_9HYPH|nr:exopeptide [Sinorhizobium medicae]PND17821.1 exopeptide [Ensifer sp. MMN_5]MDX0636428.1 exopeptide [Sinorhizobium medicae]MDX0686343.1 exopeptide [Sinorhizobium medicae]MDX0692442.1 exopeptide [Sinorhizobium medicae]
MCGRAGVAFLVVICVLIALVVSILGFVPENEVPPDAPDVPQTPLR